MSEAKRIIAQPSLKLERNKQIYTEYLAGNRYEVLAVKYNLHFNRISQIVKQQKRLNESKEVTQQ